MLAFYNLLRNIGLEEIPNFSPASDREEYSFSLLDLEIGNEDLEFGK